MKFNTIILRATKDYTLTNSLYWNLYKETFKQTNIYTGKIWLYVK